MKIPTVKQILVGTDVPLVRFARYEDRRLWYTARWQDDGVRRDFEFPVPIDDAAGAVFLPEDRAIMFMRWIRKHVEFLSKAAIEEQPDHDALTHERWGETLK